MSTQNQKPKKMKLSDLQPKAPELSIPQYTKVTEEYWKPLKEMVFNDMPQIFLRLKNAIAFFTSIQSHISDTETLQYINLQANNIVKDSEPLMAKWSELKHSIDEKTKVPMYPEEALALSFTYQTEVQQWLEDSMVLISTPLDNLIDYCSSKLDNVQNSEEEKTND